MKKLYFPHIFSQRAAVSAALFNSAWLLVDKGIRLVGGLVIGVWVARYLAPENFGLLNVIISLQGLLLVILGLGLDPVLVRYLARYPSRESVILGTSIRLRGIVAIVVGLLCLMLPVLGFFPGIPLWLWGVLFLTFLLNPFLLIRQWFESRVSSKYVVISELGAFVLSSILKIIGVVCHFSVSWFVFVIVSETLLGIVGYGIVYLRQRTAMSWQFSWRIARMLLRQSWPLLLSSAAITVYMRIDQVMVLSLSGSHEAGIYAAASRLSEILYFLPSIILSSVFPALTVLRKTNLSKYKQQLGLLFSGVSLLSYLISFAMVLMSPILVGSLYGSTYLGAAPVLAVHVWAFVWVANGLISGIFVLNEKLSKYALVRDCISATLNIGLNFVLIPRWGAMGASVATCISYSFTGFWGNAVFPALRPLFKLQLQGLMLAGLYQKWRSWRNTERLI